MTRRVLIVSPHFPPVNAPDAHRVRMAVSYLPRFGWDTTVLAVTSEDVAAPLDPWLLRTLPGDLEVVTVRAPRWPLPRPFRLESLGPRAYRPMARMGARLLSQGRFDLVYFSTTQFAVVSLGPSWRRRFGTPFVIDLQDPWLSDYYREHPHVRPPGGRLKYGLAQLGARRAEPRSVRAAAAITSVSPAYVDVLQRRYPDLDEKKLSVLPFGGSDRDFSALDAAPPQTIFEPTDGCEHWVYVGRGGADLARAARGLFRAFADALCRSPDRIGGVRMHFVGTDYAAGDRARETLRPLAAEYGIERFVEEYPHRVPYSAALRCLHEAHVLIVLGSDDRGYSPSKLYPYVLARRPMLAIVAEGGPAAGLLDDLESGIVVQFGSETNESALAALVTDTWMTPWTDGTLRPPIPDGLGTHSAEAMTERLAATFDGAVEASGGRVPIRERRA